MDRTADQDRPAQVTWRRSLVTRLSWVASVVVVVVVMAVGLGLIWMAEKAQRKQVFLLQGRNARTIALLISGYVDRGIKDLELLEVLQPLSALSAEEQKNTLERLLIQPDTIFTQITLIGADGREMIKVSRFHTYLVTELGLQADRPVLRGARAGRTTLGPVFISPDSGLLSLEIAMPCKTCPKGEILSAQINISQLWREVANVRIGQTGYAYLVDDQGRFVAYQEPATILQRYGEDMVRIPPVAAYLAGRSEDMPYTREYRGLIGMPVIGVYNPIAGTKWAVIVEQPKREAFASIQKMETYLLGLTLLGVLIAGIVVLLLTQRVAGPIRRLTEATQRIAMGDLDTTVPAVHSADEVGILAGVFGHMQAELKRLYQDLNRQVEEMRREAQESARCQQVLLDLSHMDKTDFEHSLETILAHDALLLQVEYVSYWSMNHDPEHLECRWEYCFSRQGFDRESTGRKFIFKDYPIYYQALTGRDIIVADDAQQDERTREFTADYLMPKGITSLLDVPIWLKGQLVGVVCHEHAGTPRAWKNREQIFAQSIGELVAVSLEASQRQRAEAEKDQLEEHLRQAQKMESIGRLAGGVAHDFNNLLTAISGNTELAMMVMKPDERPYARLVQVKKAAASAAELTRQLLAFSRKQIIEPKVLDLNELITHLGAMIEPLIGETISLHVHTRAKLGRIKVDAGQMEQIVMNLGLNARDAMRAGGALTIETADVSFNEDYCRRHAFGVPGAYVMLAVSDTGLGMSEEVKAHLFEPFFTTKERGKGTGLGLATIYGAVKQNNGGIEVYSEVGQGTTFKLYFPQVRDALSTDAGAAPGQDMPKGDETILLVEDNPMVLGYAQEVLDNLGYHVLSATSAEEALSVASTFRERIDLLMTDVILPGMNGRDLSIQLTAVRPDLKVLFNSGYTDDVIAQHGVLEAGVHFISKPFTAQTLARKIRETLSGA